MKTKTEVNVVLCSHDCPEWGKLGAGVYECRCECGTLSLVCGACLDAARVTECSACSQANRVGIHVVN